MCLSHGLARALGSSIAFGACLGGVNAADVEDLRHIAESTKEASETKHFLQASVIAAAFLFLINNVFSAVCVLGMFSARGDLNPTIQSKGGLENISRRRWANNDPIGQHGTL